MWIKTEVPGSIMALVVTEQPAGGGVIDVDSEVREPSEKKEKYKGPEID